MLHDIAWVRVLLDGCYCMGPGAMDILATSMCINYKIDAFKRQVTQYFVWEETQRCCGNGRYFLLQSLACPNVTASPSNFHACPPFIWASGTKLNLNEAHYVCYVLALTSTACVKSTLSLQPSRIKNLLHKRGNTVLVLSIVVCIVHLWQWPLSLPAQWTIHVGWVLKARSNPNAQDNILITI